MKLFYTKCCELSSSQVNDREETYDVFLSKQGNRILWEVSRNLEIVAFSFMGFAKVVPQPTGVSQKFIKKKIKAKFILLLKNQEFMHSFS